MEYQNENQLWRRLCLNKCLLRSRGNKHVLLHQVKISICSGQVSQKSGKKDPFSRCRSSLFPTTLLLSQWTQLAPFMSCLSQGPVSNSPAPETSAVPLIGHASLLRAGYYLVASWLLFIMEAAAIFPPGIDTYSRFSFQLVFLKIGKDFLFFPITPCVFRMTYSSPCDT